MKCPQCGNEASDSKQTTCPSCGHSDIEHAYRRYPFLWSVNVAALISLVIGGGWNLALMNNPDLGMIFWLIPLVAFYFLLTWAVISLPLVWPSSVLFAWLLDRSRQPGRTLRIRDVLIINAWTIVSAGIFILLMHVKTVYVVGQHDPIGEFTNGFMGSQTVVEGIQAFGCLLVPLAWSITTIIQAARHKQHAKLVLAMGLAAIVINLAGTVVYPIHKERVDAQAQFTWDQQQEAHLAKVRKEQKSQEAEKYRQAETKARLEREQLLAQLTFTPYSVNTNTGNTLNTVSAVLDGDYQKPSLVIAATLKQNGVERKVSLREMTTSSASPVSNDGCYPAPTLSSYPQSKDRYACVFAFTTPKGIKVYRKPDVDYFTYTDKHTFVIDGVFTVLLITSYPQNGLHDPATDLPLPQIIDSLIPVSRDIIPKQ
jgi:hypothetical protein